MRCTGQTLLRLIVLVIILIFWLILLVPLLTRARELSQMKANAAKAQSSQILISISGERVLFIRRSGPGFEITPIGDDWKIDERSESEKTILIELSREALPSHAMHTCGSKTVKLVGRSPP